MALFFMCARVLAQQASFQQEVNYVMQVRLDDVSHALQGKAEITYINRSPDTLRFIYFHLWPNAYRHGHTALSKQLLLQHKTDLFFSTPEEQGYMDSLDFKANGESLGTEPGQAYNEICKLLLNKPLLPGESISISTPFFVKLPDAKFSRLGHSGQAYYITQWFPKPAVYDSTGWHPLPYLDQGEFYSDFGSYDVSITLPENYLLAATGDRVDATAEEQFLNEQVSETEKHIVSGTRKETGMSFPPSASKLKTVRFRQNRVHDFAWFADKRFYVLHGKVEMPNSHGQVDTWVFFTNANFDLWKNALNYVNDPAVFYSRLLGDYPYKHITAVDGTIMAGGGMEYPNITVIGNLGNAYDLDATIAHEVGHNWFYGMLANNERAYPFMDEGINSYYEMRYAREKYPYQKMSYYIGRDSTSRLLGLNKVPAWKEKETAFMYSLRLHTDQPLNLPAEDYTNVNYGTIIYSKMPLVLDYLAHYMGQDKFDQAMRDYSLEFKFRHPTPADFFGALSRSSGINLDTIQQYLVNTASRIDYKIKKVKRDKNGGYNITIKNKTGTALPFTINGYTNKKPAGFVWSEGFKGKRTVHFDGEKIGQFRLDGGNLLPDQNRANGISGTRGILKKVKPLQLSFLTHYEEPDKLQAHVVPLLGVNYYNGPMAGLAVHNYGIYRKQLEYMVAPMFGFRTRTPTGFAQFDLNLFPKRVFQQITFGGKFKSFAYDRFETKNLNAANNTGFKTLVFSYLKLTRYLQLELKRKKATSTVRQFIDATSNLLFTDSLNTGEDALLNLALKGPAKLNRFSLLNQLEYRLVNQRAIDPCTLHLTVQQSKDMSKISGEFNSEITLNKKQYVSIRFFGGAFISGSEDSRGFYAFRPSGYTGSQDYLFEGNYFARNEPSGIGFSQFMERDGNMKVWTFLGRSPDWMLALNLKSPALPIVPLKLFVDVMTCDGRALGDEKVLWDAGINLTLWKDIIEVYVPVAYSAYIRDKLALNGMRFVNTIRFTFNIHKLAPKNIIQDNFR